MIGDRNEVDKNAMGGTELMGLGLQKHVDPELLSKFNIIRSRVRHVDPDKKNILWLHDLPHDPESAHLKDPNSLARFDKLVYVSNWQKDMYQLFLGVPPSKGVVIKNAIEPFDEGFLHEHKNTSDKIKLIYHPTPHRGLEILVPVFEALCKEFDNLELDVFSSFKLYGWEQRDEPYRAVIERCKEHPNINYHGSQPQEVVRKALAAADIFAYPSIWQETSCICAMEAMSARCLMVLPNYAALPETTAGFAFEYNWDENVNRHGATFYSRLRDAILTLKTNAPAIEAHLDLQKWYADKSYSWSNRRHLWNSFLESRLVDSD